MKYRVIFRGETEKHVDVKTVKKKLSVVFKSDASEIERLFSGNKMVILKNADLEICEKLRKVGKRCGAIFHVEKQKKKVSKKKPRKDPKKNLKAKPTGLAVLKQKDAPGEDEKHRKAVTGLVASYPIFANLDEDEIRLLVSFLKVSKHPADEILLKKGEPGKRLYVIVKGGVNVISEDGMSIAILGKGEVFGEMSLLSGDPIGATVKALEPVTLLYIRRTDFKHVLKNIPSLQLNFTRLLAKRMAEINLARSEEFASGMAGKLAEMPPGELFQALNINQKTGVLTLKSPIGSACLYFRDGQIVGANYEKREGRDAFFEILKIKNGRFKFIPDLPPEEKKLPPIGDFTYLLMEGLRRIDEENKKFLRTVMPNLAD